MRNINIYQIGVIGLFVILFTLFQKENMFNLLESSSSIFATYSPLLLVVLSISYVLKYRFTRCFHKSFKRLYQFQFVVLAITLFYSIFLPLSYLLLYFVIFIPVLSAFFTRAFLIKNDDDNFIILFFISFIFLFGFYMENHYIELLSDKENVTNASYTILYFLPLLLCSNSKLIKITSISLTVVAVLLSLKRGSISALSIGLLVYSYLLFFKISTNRSLILKLLLITLGCLIFYECLVYFNNLSDNSILDRFSAIEEDKGSGRLDVFEHTFDMIRNSNFLQILFGHGWNMVVYDSTLGLSAHNDHLEIIYDFGLFAYLLYIIMYIRLVKLNILLIKIKSQLAAPLAMSLILFLFGSLISHIAIYPYYMTIFTITWSYIIISFNKRHMQNNR